MLDSTVLWLFGDDFDGFNSECDYDDCYGYYTLDVNFIYSENGDISDVDCAADDRTIGGSDHGNDDDDNDDADDWQRWQWRYWWVFL